MLKITTHLKEKLRKFIEDRIGRYDDFIIPLQSWANELQSLMRIHDPKLYNDIISMKEEGQWRNYEDRKFFIDTTTRSIEFFHKFSIGV